MKRVLTQSCSLPVVAQIERYVIGACLHPDEARMVAEMDVIPEMFYDVRYARIFAACMALLKDKIQPDLVTVAQYLALNNIRLAEAEGNEEFLAELFDSIYKDPKTEVEVNLPEQTITNKATGKSEHFEINAYKKDCLINGLDDIDYLLANKSKIEAFEAAR